MSAAVMMFTLEPSANLLKQTLFIYEDGSGNLHNERGSLVAGSKMEVDNILA